MRLSTLILSMYASAACVLADVQFVTPAAGSTVATLSLTITWRDSGVAPSITDLSSYTLNLMTGSNTAPTDLGAIQPAGSKFSATSISVAIPPGLGGVGANAYFLKMTSVATAGGIVINYSGRFAISAMTGTFDAATIALNAAAGVTGPATVNQVAAAAAAPGPAAAIGDANFAIPYNQQVGNVKYAPMQPVPPTKITAVNVSPLWPTSAVPTATTFLPVAVVTTTYTQARTDSVSSHANTATAAAQPSDDMQRFLNRWKD